MYWLRFFASMFELVIAGSLCFVQISYLEGIGFAKGQQKVSPIKAPKIEPVVVDDKIQEAKLIQKINPLIPGQAGKSVLIRLIINEEGSVWNAFVIESRGALLDAAAIEAAHKWRYSPTLLNGVAIPVSASAYVIFAAGETVIDPQNRKRPHWPTSASPLFAPLQLSSGMLKARLVYWVKPIYPEQAKREHLSGTRRTVVIVTIDPEGFVYAAIPTEGESNALHEAAVTAVRKWRFSPVLLNNEPLWIKARIEVIFEP